MVFETIASADSAIPARVGCRITLLGESQGSEVGVTVESPRRRVLIAEDEALIRLDLAEMLAEAGYDVVAQASDGEQAVEFAREYRPDLVIMDVKMPRLDGI